MNEIHYVYNHVDPISREVIYTGHGKGERAYRCSSSGKDDCNYGHRSKAHAEKLLEWQYAGYTPSDWVEIICAGLSKSEACVLEQSIIRQIEPKFNKPMGLSLLKLRGEDILRMNKLREQGYSYKKIANMFDVSTMTVYRSFNNRNKNNG